MGQWDDGTMGIGSGRVNERSNFKLDLRPKAGRDERLRDGSRASIQTVTISSASPLPTSSLLPPGTDVPLGTRGYRCPKI